MQQELNVCVPIVFLFCVAVIAFPHMVDCSDLLDFYFERMLPQVPIIWQDAGKTCNWFSCLLVHIQAHAFVQKFIIVVLTLSRAFQHKMHVNSFLYECTAIVCLEARLAFKCQPIDDFLYRTFFYSFNVNKRKIAHKPNWPNRFGWYVRPCKNNSQNWTHWM